MNKLTGKRLSIAVIFLLVILKKRHKINQLQGIMGGAEKKGVIKKVNPQILPGQHKITIIINGVEMEKVSFELM